MCRDLKSRNATSLPCLDYSLMLIRVFSAAIQDLVDPRYEKMRLPPIPADCVAAETTAGTDIVLRHFARQWKAQTTPSSRVRLHGAKKARE